MGRLKCWSSGCVAALVCWALVGIGTLTVPVAEAEAEAQVTAPNMVEYQGSQGAYSAGVPWLLIGSVAFIFVYDEPNCIGFPDMVLPSLSIISIKYSTWRSYSWPAGLFCHNI